MKRAVQAAAVFALLAIGLFFLRLTLNVRPIARELLAMIDAAHKTAETSNAAVVDLGRTILIAAGTLNIARDTLRDEQKTIRAANEQTIATMKNVDRLVANVDQSQQQIAAHVDAALTSIDPVMGQMRQDLAALEPVTNQAREDLAALDPVITAAKPVLDNTASTMANVDRISADLAKVTDQAVAPKPWYKRIAGDLWVPVKLAAIFAK